MDTRKLARQALALADRGEVPSLIAAVDAVVKAELGALGGATARQERLWFEDVLRLARAAKQDARALNGGVGRGQGRPGNIAEAAARLRQIAARERNRDALDSESLRAAIADAHVALAELEAEQQRRGLA